MVRGIDLVWAGITEKLGNKLESELNDCKFDFSPLYATSLKQKIKTFVFFSDRQRA